MRLSGFVQAKRLQSFAASSAHVKLFLTGGVGGVVLTFQQCSASRLTRWRDDGLPKRAKLLFRQRLCQGGTASGTGVAPKKNF